MASALEVIGERWTLLILREISYGVHRFDAIQRNTGAPRQLVDKRLKNLLAAGVIGSRQYTQRPPRFEYYATRAGEELRPILTLLNAWGTTWLPDSVHTRTSPAAPASNPSLVTTSPSGHRSRTDETLVLTPDLLRTRSGRQRY